MTDFRRMMNECPTVVGMLTTALESGGSLDSAVREVAAEGPPLSAGMFTRAVRTTDTKGASSLGAALTAEVSALPASASGYRHSVLLCIAASESSGQEERLRLLREASDIALDSVRTMGEAYSASLTVPCMTVFGLGIMVPMILMSIVPLLGMGGLFGTTSVDGDMVVLLTVVAIPAVILVLSMAIRGRNPFASEPIGPPGFAKALPLLVAVPLALFQFQQGSGPEDVVLLSVAPAAAMTAILLAGDRIAERARASCESGLRDSVFEMGNRMLSGETFETACTGVLLSRDECGETAERLERELLLCRGDIGAAVDSSVSPVSPEVSRALRDIQRCSEEDVDNAGRLAIALGRQFHNGDSVRRSLELRLKSMTDMMVGTAVVFAPMVLGMSVSMLGPLSEVAGYQSSMDTGAVLSAYIVELCILISVLTTSLGDRGGFGTGLWRFCLMAPVALIVFRVCSGISLRRGYHRVG